MSLCIYRNFAMSFTLRSPRSRCVSLNGTSLERNLQFLRVSMATSLAVNSCYRPRKLVKIGRARKRLVANLNNSSAFCWRSMGSFSRSTRDWCGAVYRGFGRRLTPVDITELRKLMTVIAIFIARGTRPSF